MERLILKINKDNKSLVSWMSELPKVNKYYDGNAQRYIKVGDVKRVLAGTRKTAGGFLWREVLV